MKSRGEKPSPVYHGEGSKVREIVFFKVTASMVDLPRKKTEKCSYSGSTDMTAFRALTFNNQRLPIVNWLNSDESDNVYS
jgi:hypothetical protein